MYQFLPFRFGGYHDLLVVGGLPPLSHLSGAELYDEARAPEWRWSAESNSELLGSLREDKNSQALHKVTWDDASMGRMSHPQRATDVDLSKVFLFCVPRLTHVVLACCKVLLVPRFAVEQGLRPDGSTKIRAVDHFSWSASYTGKRRSRRTTKQHSVNGHYTMPDIVRHDHLDDLLAAMRLWWNILGQVGHLCI